MVDHYGSNVRLSTQRVLSVPGDANFLDLRPLFQDDECRHQIGRLRCPSDPISHADRYTLCSVLFVSIRTERNFGRRTKQAATHLSKQQKNTPPTTNRPRSEAEHLLGRPDECFA